MQSYIEKLPATCIIRQGLTLSTQLPESDYFQKPISFTLNGILLNIHVGGSGEGNYSSLLSDYKVNSKSNFTVFSAVNSDIGEDSIEPDKDYNFINIASHKDFLEQILPENTKSEELFGFFQSRKNILDLGSRTINPKTKIITQNILANSYNSDLRHLFLESAVLEILYTELDEFFNQKESKKQKIVFSASDKEAIYHAKEILEKNISNPPTLSELSRLVALNEFKLKVGFKRFLNQSPCKLSIIHRLQVAKGLLQTSDLNISEIAKKVGYNSSSTFSNAFYKCFKIRPMELIKKRKYYY